MDKNLRVYLLAIRRNNNDYLPLEFNLIKGYEGENLNTLDGIDNFTKKYNEFELVQKILETNIVDSDEKFQEFVIIYREKNKYRELKEGPIFKKDENVLDINYITKLIVSNLDNKDFINHIYNMKDRFSNQHTFELIYLIKNVNYLYSITNMPGKLLASLLASMPYEDRRYISKLVYDRCLIKDKRKENVKVYKNVA